MNAGAASDTGLLRERNEDRYWMDPDSGVFLVVDGVGGHAAGELAAQTAVDAVRESLTGALGTAEERVRQAIALANDRIFAMAEADEVLRGMACVLTLAVVEGGEVTIGHVGDSRLYLIGNGVMRKLTSDHSPVGEAEDSGELGELEAMRHPRRNEVFRDVGSRRRAAGDPEFIEILRRRFRPDAALLLSSDGLTDHLASAEVREIVERYQGDAAGVVRELVEAANRAGGRDNITVVFVAGPEFKGRAGGAAGITRPRTALTRPRMRAGILTGRLAFLTYGMLLGMLVWAALRARGG
jgi:serine/threonine protein phosphatase PrpC